MKYCLILVLFIGLLGQCFAQDNFDRARERRIMMDLLTESNPHHLPASRLQYQPLVIEGLDTTTPKKRAFLEYYRDVIYPQERELERLDLLASVYSVAYDRALGDTPEENEEWSQKSTQFEKEYKQIANSEAFKNKYKRFAELAEGLEGELVRYATESWNQIQISSFSENEAELNNQLTETMTEIQKIANNSEFNRNLGPAEKKQNDAKKAFFAGEMTFQEAAAQIKEAKLEGRVAKSNDVANKGADLFQRAAVIRTQLAKRKGFNNWAEYQLATQAYQYSEGFKTVEEKVAFLEQILSATEAPYREFLRKMGESYGVDTARMTQAELELMELPAGSLIRDYFPKERGEVVWQETMRQNGFSEEKLATVNIDSFPRQGKQTHAYMASVQQQRAGQQRVLADSLNVEGYRWLPASIFIVQNVRDDGVGNWETIWHEGGHALDYAHRENIVDLGPAYGYTETHSMTMERFFRDKEFLLSIGQTREGQKISEELVDEYLRNSILNELKSMRVQASYALYDILLWSREYTEEGPRFVDSARGLYGELYSKASLINKDLPMDSRLDWRLGGFMTGHFYSGSVRYFGYIVANVAAELSAIKLWDDLEKETGRRSFYRQPSFAERLIEGYYKRGFKEAFPQSIERFIGKPYRPEELIEETVRTVREFKIEKSSFWSRLKSSFSKGLCSVLKLFK